MSRQKPAHKLRAPQKKTTGHRGQWTADVNGRELAVLHNTWRVGTTGYFDPMEAAKTDGAKHKRLTDALLENDVAVVQRDAPDDPGMARSGYIGLFS
ncbi:hypothetical protein [Roseitranquillus sediminis]|uniref:hypothetical protein n=1 Tax=Roseitranquillus sediminis TaxID=2809051 RepID=UPI001D0C0503|nr:hypothetical protein [Roseitranquillus sediminis]MBM9593525.1 hypothetical protein [Roseitranquillus sediminis]